MVRTQHSIFSIFRVAGEDGLEIVSAKEKRQQGTEMRAPQEVARSTAHHEALKGGRKTQGQSGASKTSTGDKSKAMVNNWTLRNAGDMHGCSAFAGRPPVIRSEKEQPAWSPKDDKKRSCASNCNVKMPSRQRKAGQASGLCGRHR